MPSPIALGSLGSLGSLEQKDRHTDTQTRVVMERGSYKTLNCISVHRTYTYRTIDLARTLLINARARETLSTTNPVSLLLSEPPPLVQLPNILRSQFLLPGFLPLLLRLVRLAHAAELPLR